MVSAVPKGFSTVTPFIMVNGADKVIDFAKKAFGAEVMSQLDHPDGTVWHAQLKIGDAMVLIGDSMGEHPAMPVSLYLYVDDADGLYDKALKAGGKAVTPLENQFYGDRSGGVQDPTGNIWWVSTHVEDVSDAELRKRSLALVNKQKAA